MKYLFDINHPAQVHLLANTIKILKSHNHTVIITSVKTELVQRLFSYYEIKPDYLFPSKHTQIGKILSQVRKLIKTFQIAYKYSFDLGIGTSYTVPQISRISSFDSIVLDDDDDNIEPLFVKFSHTFANSILSPDALKGKRNNLNTLFYNGCHELAYLHPQRFTPDSKVIGRIGIQENEPYFVLRFVSMQGHHDLGQAGFSTDQKRLLISYLNKKGTVFISSEHPIEKEFEKYQLTIPPEDIHSLLYYATMFIGDSQTMTSEAAILGIPALKYNTFAGKLSIPNLLEEKYSLCYSFQKNDFQTFMGKIKKLLEMPNTRTIWEKRRQQFLKDTIDVTGFMVWFIENYPKSVHLMKETPNYQLNFR